MKEKRKHILLIILLIIVLTFATPLVISAVTQSVVYAGYNSDTYYQYGQAEYTEDEFDTDSQIEVVENSPIEAEYFAQSNYSQLLQEMQVAIDELRLELFKLVQNDMLYIVENAANINTDNSTVAGRQNQIEISERHMYRVEYYNVIALRQRSELLSRNIILSERQLEVERVRLSIGETVQGNVDLAYARLQAVTAERRLTDEFFSLRAEIINMKRGFPGFEFIGDYSLPFISSPNARSINSLISGLLSNSISFEMITQQLAELNLTLTELIEAYVDLEIIEAVQAEINYLIAEQRFMRSQIEMAATARWITYLDARMYYDLANTMRPILTARLNLIVELYVLGEISYLEKLTHEFEVYQEIFNADMATVALAIAIADINALMLGVVA